METAIMEQDGSGSRGAPVRAYVSGGRRLGMKLVTAVVRPHCLEDLRIAVAQMGIGNLTVTEIELYEDRVSRTEYYRGHEYRQMWEQRLRVELTVEEDLAEQVTEAVCNIARAGRGEAGQVLWSRIGAAWDWRDNTPGPGRQEEALQKLMTVGGNK